MRAGIYASSTQGRQEVLPSRRQLFGVWLAAAVLFGAMLLVARAARTGGDDRFVVFLAGLAAYLVVLARLPRTEQP